MSGAVLTWVVAISLSFWYVVTLLLVTWLG